MVTRGSERSNAIMAKVTSSKMPQQRDPHGTIREGLAFFLSEIILA
jgi:hypothetical protein